MFYIPQLEKIQIQDFFAFNKFNISSHQILNLDTRGHLTFRSLALHSNEKTEVKFSGKFITSISRAV